MKIVTVVGARPQFVKAAVVSHALRGHAGPVALQELLVHTGQHYDDNMSAVFFRELGMPEPAYNLGIGPGTHGAQTGRMLAGVEQVLLAERPDCVLVYGDTNTTLAAALAAVKLHMPVAHIEAGLRSFNRRMPEEINRVLADHAADLLFAPTPAAVENLRREGIPDARIRLVGDVMYDAALHYGRQAELDSRVLEALALAPRGYILATVHRPENTDDAARLAAILEGLARWAARLRVVLPLHPRTRQALARAAVPGPVLEALDVIEPAGYLDMLMLEKHARLIATDSGGVQKEAYFYRVPCVTLREQTEWVELVGSGWNRICPPRSADAVAQGIAAGLDAPPGEEGSLYGDGCAARRIVDELAGWPAAAGARGERDS